MPICHPRRCACWRKLGEITRGPLFRRVETHFDGSIRAVGQGALYGGTITLIYKRLVRRAFDRRDQRGSETLLRPCGRIFSPVPKRNEALHFRGGNPVRMLCQRSVRLHQTGMALLPVPAGPVLWPMTKRASKM
jgi:hypothetical protein